MKFIAGRFAYEAKPQLKYAGFAVGQLDGMRVFVLDVLRGSFRPSVIAHELAHLAKTHGVNALDIEETPGSRYYEQSIKDYAATMGHRLTVNWLEFQEDDTVRALRVKNTEPLVNSKRILFSMGIRCMAELNNQFGNFGMIDEQEIPDAVSRLAERLPKSILVTDQTEAAKAAWKSAQEQDQCDRVYGLGQYAIPQGVVEVETPYEPPKNSLGLEDIMPGLNG
jgi:hypothetical protein